MENTKGKRAIEARDVSRMADGFNHVKARTLSESGSDDELQVVQKKPKLDHSELIGGMENTKGKRAVEARGVSRMADGFNHAKARMLSESGSDDEQQVVQKKPKLDHGIVDGNQFSNFVKEPSHKASSQDATYSKFSKNMMKKMGYVEGKGLGKQEQGRVEPVEASKQRGKRGLGAGKQGTLEGPSDVGWDFEAEQKELSDCERLVWYQNPHLGQIDLEDRLKDWAKEGDLKLTIDDEMTFCHPSTLTGVLSSKSTFDTLDAEEMRRARTRSNPFETIRSAFFQNRAAMKMANMDSVFDFMFTSPRTDSGPLVAEGEELFSFADVCAGPGGFSEYVLWRTEGLCRGFGFTLVGENDFRMHDFNAGPPEMFQPYYGTKGDGNVFDEENQASFKRFVMSNTNDMGVHLVMADGGFSVEGQENIQEILSHRLYLCQFLVALEVLRSGGNFVCKLFDLFTPFSVGLVYLMSFCFDQIAIFKPVTSRPANSERYLVCCGHRKEGCGPVVDHFHSINREMDLMHPGRRDSSRMMVECVPVDVLLEDESFYDYIRTSNDRLGRLQIMSLLKLKTFMQNPDLVDPYQSELRNSCLDRWKVPDRQKRDLFRKEAPSSRLNRLLKQQKIRYEPEILDKDRAKLAVGNRREFRALVVSSRDRYFLLGSGKGHVHRVQASRAAEGCWESCEKMELPKDTLLDVEFVEEQRGEEGRNRKRVLVVHVNDALVWFGKDLTGLSFDARRNLASLLLAAMFKDGRHDLIGYHVKTSFRLEDVETELFSRVQLGVAKGQGYVKSRLLPISDGEKRFVLPAGFCLVRVIRHPWVMAWSRGQRREYYFNTKTNLSSFDVRPEAFASYRECLEGCLLWMWGAEGSVSQETLSEMIAGSAEGL